MQASVSDPAAGGWRWRAAYTSADYFGAQLRSVAERLDPRSDDELVRDARTHEDAGVREQASLELSARRGQGAFDSILDAFREEPDREARIGLLDELAYLDSTRMRDALQALNVQSDSLIDAWSMAQFGTETRSDRRAMTDDREPFDQVIKLRIKLACYVQVQPDQWVTWAISPLVVRRIAGQLYACSRVDTRLERIGVTKQLQGLHADGSLHLENTLFLGRTAMVGAREAAFNFETLVDAPFYPSGRLGDQSKGMLRTPLHVSRMGMWQLDPDISVRGISAINNVTGMIRGWGYADPERVRVDENGRLVMTPGIFDLGGITDQKSSGYMNFYIEGGYRGFIADYDGDGLIDLNTMPSYMTIDCEIDRDRDGVAEVPGDHYDVCPAILGEAT